MSTITEQPQTSAELEKLLIDVMRQCARLTICLRNFAHLRNSDIETHLFDAACAARDIDAQLFDAERAETLH